MNDQRSKGVVVITGSSSGIGEATAEAFAGRGTRLVLAARDVEALEQVAARFRRLGARGVEAVAADVTDASAARALAERAVASVGGIDVWVAEPSRGSGRARRAPGRAAASRVFLPRWNGWRGGAGRRA